MPSVATLIEPLDDESRGMRQNAHWALRGIAGLSLEDEPTAWNESYEKEGRASGC